MASVSMNRFKRNLVGGAISLSATDCYCALVTSAIASYTTDQIIDTNSWRTLSAVEASGSGYIAGGTLLQGKRVVQDDTNNWAYWDANDVVWANSTIDGVRGAVIYVSGTYDNCVYHEFSEIKSSVDGNFTIIWGTYGIARLI